eukprot:677664-Pyramimonas_sp.AAC.1
MPILGVPFAFQGESLRLSSPFGVSVSRIGISSRLVKGCHPERQLVAPACRAQCEQARRGGTSLRKGP